MIKELFTNQIVEVEGITSKDMKSEWNDKDTDIVDGIIKNLFRMKTLTDHRGQKHKLSTMASIDNFLGLAYTSSSSFAMYGNTNTRFCLDSEEVYNIDCFGLGHDNCVYIWCTDYEENEKVYKVI